MGDSLVRWATGDLKFDDNIEVQWEGKSGAGLGDILTMLSGRKMADPSVLILHIGTNDLVCIDEFSMRQRILLLLNTCTRRFPQTCLVWSEILPRLFYFGANAQNALERKRKALNRWARKHCTKLGAHYLPHPCFFGRRRSYIVMMEFTCRPRATVSFAKIFVPAFSRC